MILTLAQTLAADGIAAPKLTHSKLSGFHPVSLQFGLDIFTTNRRLLLAPELCYPVFQGTSVITVILYICCKLDPEFACSNKTGSE